MEMVLVVVRPFGGRRAGDIIGDANSIREVLKGEHSSWVVRVAPAAATMKREG